MSPDNNNLPADLKSRQKQGYEAVAEQYNDWTKKHHHYRHKYIEELCKHVPELTAEESSPTLVELGCGNGVPVLETLLSRNKTLRVTANDMSEAQINFARGNLSSFGDRVTFSPGDMTKLSFKDASQTAVVALYSLVHLPQGEQVDMLRNIHAWLQPGGCLLANFEEQERTGAVMEGWLGEKGWMFMSGLGAKGSLDVLREVGFVVEVEFVERDSTGPCLWVIARKA